MRRLAWSLAVLAALCVAATAITAVQLRRDDGGPRAAPPPLTPAGAVASFEHGRVVHDGSGDARFEVPRTADWSVDTTATIGYGHRASVLGPAVFREAFCRLAPASSRAFVGFTTAGVAGVSPATANAALAARWVRTIARGRVHSSIRSVAFVLRDGTAAVRADAEIDVGRRTGCDPPRVHLSLVSLATGTGVADLVLVRDAGASGVLDAVTADAILVTLEAG